MAHTHCTGPATGTGTEPGPGPGPRMGKWVCNPSVPGPLLCGVPSFGVVCTVKGIIYKPIIPSLSSGAIPGPGPVQCE